MDCKEAQILLALHIMGDLEPDSRQCLELEAHLLSCQACRERYEIRKQTIEFIEQHKTIFAEVLRTPEEKRAAEQEEIEHSWKRIEAKLDELEAQERIEKQAKFRRLLIRISGVAACLVIGVFIWLAFSVYSRPKVTEKLTFQQSPFASKPYVELELVSENGNILVPANQQIASTDELKTLIINGKYRLMMNAKTTLSVKPFVDDGRIGCLVKLATGQIFTHVEHDGNPFVVETSHGKAVITGTTFDVKVIDDSTTLVVSEGTVQFESENGAVKVAAGQTSEIVGQSAPTRPVLCNAAELTAWATGYKPEPILTQVKSSTDLLELPLSFRQKPIVLDETGYGRWVEWERNWFKQEFPWIFQLKDALAKEGIEVDYPELLIQSGDVWQFVCLEVSPARFSAIDPNSLLNTASDYGFDKQWLLENVSAAKYALEKPGPSKDSFTGLKAFERWFKYLNENEAEGLKPPTPLYLYHASKYLAETRSLIWFAVRDGKYSLTDEKRAEVLVLLQKEVTAACKCQNDELYPEKEPKPSCGDDKCQEPVESVIEYLKTMKDVEERIAEYGICK